MTFTEWRERESKSGTLRQSSGSESEAWLEPEQGGGGVQGGVVKG